MRCVGFLAGKYYLLARKSRDTLRSLKSFVFPFDINITIVEDLGLIHDEDNEKKLKRAENEGKYSFACINKLRALVLSAPAFHLFSTEEFRQCLTQAAEGVLKKGNDYLREEEDLSDYLAVFKKYESQIILLTDASTGTELCCTIFLSGFSPSGDRRTAFEDADTLRYLRLTTEFLQIRFNYR